MVILFISSPPKAAALHVQRQIAVKNWAGLGPSRLVLSSQGHEGWNTDLCAHVHTQLRNTWDLLLRCLSWPAQTTWSDLCPETFDVLRWCAERSLGLEWRCFPSGGFVTTDPGLWEEEKGHQSPGIPRQFWGHRADTSHLREGRARRPDAYFHPDVFSLPRFRVSFQPGSRPPRFRALVSIIGNSPVVSFASRKFCFLPRTWKNKHNLCPTEKKNL